MQTQNRIREMLYGALLTAMALLIPIAFQGWLQVHIPPFTPLSAAMFLDAGHDHQSYGSCLSRYWLRLRLLYDSGQLWQLEPQSTPYSVQ